MLGGGLLLYCTRREARGSARALAQAIPAVLCYQALSFEGGSVAGWENPNPG